MAITTEELFKYEKEFVYKATAKKTKQTHPSAAEQDNSNL